MFYNLQKIFKFGFQNFARNFWFGLLTMSILVLLLLSINALIILNFLTDEASRGIKDKVDISVYLKPETSEAEAQSLRAYLLNLPSVTSAVYISPEEVLQRFKKDYGKDESVMASLGLLEKNPFGGSIIIETKDINDYKAILAQLDNPPYQKIIENKDFENHENLVKAINRMTGYFKQFIMAVSLFFALIALIIIFNMIKIAIYTHKEEIGVMRLIGASNWFIRAPFLIEAVFYSLISVIIAFILVFPLSALLQRKIFDFFNTQEAGNIFIYYRTHLLSLIGFQFLITASLAVLSALLATSRYLKK